MVEFNDRRKEIKPRTISQRYPMLFDPSTDSPEGHKPIGGEYDDLGEVRRSSSSVNRAVNSILRRQAQFRSRHESSRHTAEGEDLGPWCADCMEHHW